MERSDYPNAHTPQGSFFEKGDKVRITYPVWIGARPCPDGKADCKRCHISYASYLAYQEILDAIS